MALHRKPIFAVKKFKICVQFLLTSAKMLRIDEADHIYQEIKTWYGTFICSKDGKTCIAAFDAAMPSYKDRLTAVKKIDYLLWSKR